MMAAVPAGSILIDSVIVGSAVVEICGLHFGTAAAEGGRHWSEARLMLLPSDVIQC